VQVLLKKTTTVSVQICNGSYPFGAPISKIFQVKSGPVLQMVMSFNQPPPALDLLVSLSASTMNIDARRFDSAYVQSSRRQSTSKAQLDVVTSSMVDAKSLQDLADGRLVAALARSGISVLALTTKIVTPLIPTGVAGGGDGIGRDATIGLAVGLGVGIPLLLLAGFAYYVYDKSQRKAAHGKVCDTLGQPMFMSCCDLLLLLLFVHTMWLR
jgi:hypothetical protein